MAVAASASESASEAQIAAFADDLQRIRSAVASAVVGHDEVVELAAVVLVLGGHLLIDDVPGVGKTTLAKALARATAGTASRIQFTPDLLPSDITGSTVWDPGTRTFGFHPGPVFANVVLADEINRASPKTQSALLEVMEEHQVTTDGTTRAVPEPFLVIATQNPLDHHGTFPLPDAQIDRFFARVRLGYPTIDDELAVVARNLGGIAPAGQVVPVIDAATIAAMGVVARSTHVAPALLRYCVELVAATRQAPELRAGASPRGSIALVAAAQGLACARGRAFVTPDDVKAVVEPVLAHRLHLRADVAASGTTTSDVVAELVRTHPLPRERGERRDRR
jgi:MoxR-like ATPase